MATRRVEIGLHHYRRRALWGLLSGLSLLGVALALAISSAVTGNPTLGVVSEPFFVGAGILLILGLPMWLTFRRIRETAAKGNWSEAICTFVPETLELDVSLSGRGSQACLAPLIISRGRYRRLQEMRGCTLHAASDQEAKRVVLALDGGQDLYLLAVADRRPIQRRWARFVARLNLPT